MRGNNDESSSLLVSGKNRPSPDQRIGAPNEAERQQHEDDNMRRNPWLGSILKKLDSLTARSVRSSDAFSVSNFINFFVLSAFSPLNWFRGFDASVNAIFNATHPNISTAVPPLPSNISDVVPLCNEFDHRPDGVPDPIAELCDQLQHELDTVADASAAASSPAYEAAINNALQGTNVIWYYFVTSFFLSTGAYVLYQTASHLYQRCTGSQFRKDDDSDKLFHQVASRIKHYASLAYGLYSFVKYHTHFLRSTTAILEQDAKNPLINPVNTTRTTTPCSPTIAPMTFAPFIQWLSLNDQYGNDCQPTEIVRACSAFGWLYAPVLLNVVNTALAFEGAISIGHALHRIIKQNLHKTQRERWEEYCTKQLTPPPSLSSFYNRLLNNRPLTPEIPERAYLRHFLYTQKKRLRQLYPFLALSSLYIVALNIHKTAVNNPICDTLFSFFYLDDCRGSLSKKLNHLHITLHFLSESNGFSNSLSPLEPSTVEKMLALTLPMQFKSLTPDVDILTTNNSTYGNNVNMFSSPTSTEIFNLYPLFLFVLPVAMGASILQQLRSDYRNRNRPQAPHQAEQYERSLNQHYLSCWAGSTIMNLTIPYFFMTILLSTSLDSGLTYSDYPCNKLCFFMHFLTNNWRLARQESPHPNAAKIYPTVGMTQLITWDAVMFYLTAGYLTYYVSLVTLSHCSVQRANDPPRPPAGVEMSSSVSVTISAPDPRARVEAPRSGGEGQLPHHTL